MAFKATDYLFTPGDIIRLWDYLLDLTLKQWFSLFVIAALVYVGNRYQIGLTNLVFLGILFWVFLFNVDARVPLKGALISLVAIILVILAGKYSPYFIDVDAWSETIAVWVYFFLAIGVLKQVKDHFVEGEQPLTEETQTSKESPVAYVLGPEKKPKRPTQKMVVDLSARPTRSTAKAMRPQYQSPHQDLPSSQYDDEEIVVPRKPDVERVRQTPTQSKVAYGREEGGAADDLLEVLRLQEIERTQRQGSIRGNISSGIESNEPQDYSDQQELLFAPYVRSELIPEDKDKYEERGAFDLSELPVYEEPPIPRMLSKEEQIELRQYAYQQAAFTDDELFEVGEDEVEQITMPAPIKRSVAVPLEKRPARAHPVAKGKVTKKYQIVKVGNRMTVRDLEKERKAKIKAEYEKKKAKK